MNADEPHSDTEPQENEYQRQLRLDDLKFRLMVGATGCIIVASLIAYSWALFRDPPPPSPAPRQPSTALVAPRPPKQPAVLPPAPKQQPKTTLASIAKQQAAILGTPGGPAYDTNKENVQLVTKPIPGGAAEIIEARAALERYLKTTSWQEKQTLIFNPERCEPFMREFYEKRAESDPQPGRFLGANHITADASSLISLGFACPARPDVGLRANFHRTRTGKLLLDWETWTAWSERSWPGFKRERSQLPVLMRAVASESKYYNYEFSEDWRWLAVKLRSPDGLHSVTGYVQRKSMLGVMMANLIGVPLPHKLPDGTPMPALRLSGTKAIVTVRLAFPPSAQSDHCVKIIDLLADRWMLFPGEEK